MYPLFHAYRLTRRCPCGVVVNMLDCNIIVNSYHIIKFTFSLLPLETWRCPWRNGYRHRKWTRLHEFKSLTRLIAFSHSTNTLGKGVNPIILPPDMGK